MFLMVKTLFYQCEDCIRNTIKRLIYCFITILFFVFSINTPKNTPYFFCYPLKSLVLQTITTRLRQDYGKITARLPTDRIYYLLRQQSFICWQKWLYISSNTKQALELSQQNVGTYRVYKKIILSMPPIMPQKRKVTP